MINNKIDNCINFLERNFYIADIKSDYLCDLLKSVLFKIIKSTGNDEIEFGWVIEEPTIAGYEAEVTEDGEINLDSIQLKKYDDDVAKAIIAHELAHFHLGHHLNKSCGLECEDEADELAKSWGFNIEKFREVCGPATLH